MTDPDQYDQATVDAVGKITEALETIERDIGDRNHIHVLTANQIIEQYDED